MGSSPITIAVSLLSKGNNINLKFKNMKIFLPLLQVLFIGLKLTNQIDWNWFCVLSPSLYLLAVILLLLLLLLIGWFKNS